MFFEPNNQTAKRVVFNDNEQAISLEPGDIVVRGDYRIEAIGQGQLFRTAEVIAEDISDGPDSGERRRFPALADLEHVKKMEW